MASIQAVAIKRATALGRLSAAMKLLGEELGVAPLTLPTQGRDQHLIYVAQLETLADYLEGVVKALHPVEPAKIAEAPVEDDAESIPPVAAPDYDAMTRAEAVKRAEAAGMPVAKNTTKAEAVDYLMAAAGITEDQQAALDTGADADEAKG